MKLLLKYNTTSCKIVGGYIPKATVESYKEFLAASGKSYTYHVYNVIPSKDCGGPHILRIGYRYPGDDIPNTVYVESNGILFSFSPRVYNYIIGLLSSENSYFLLAANINHLLYLQEPRHIQFEISVRS